VARKQEQPHAGTLTGPADPGNASGNPRMYCRTRNRAHCRGTREAETAGET
jgi:hypothetical protein